MRIRHREQERLTLRTYVRGRAAVDKTMLLADPSSGMQILSTGERIHANLFFLDLYATGFA
jgi:hypothetical protein